MIRAVVLAFFVAVVYAANMVNVAVGGVGKRGEVVFSPRVVHAKLGDIVSFVFHADEFGGSGNHSIVQTSLEWPCSPLAGGFASPVSHSAGTTFRIIITDVSQPIYFACGSTKALRIDDHCQSGEVGVINPIVTGFANEADYEGLDLVERAKSMPSDGAMDEITVGGTGYGTGIGAQVFAWYTPEQGYSVPPSESVIYTAPGTDDITPLVPPPESTAQPSHSGSLAPSAIGGIAAGVAALVALIALAIWRALSVRRRRAKTGTLARRISDARANRGTTDTELLEKRSTYVQPKLEV